MSSEGMAIGLSVTNGFPGIVHLGDYVMGKLTLNDQGHHKLNTMGSHMGHD